MKVCGCVHFLKCNFGRFVCDREARSRHSRMIRQGKGLYRARNATHGKIAKNGGNKKQDLKTASILKKFWQRTASLKKKSSYF